MNAGEVGRALDLVLQLKRRYPGVEILDVRITPTAAGAWRQWVRLLAPLEALKAHGLVTEAMVEYCRRNDSRRRRPPAPCGDDFFLEESSPHAWELSIYTWIDGPPCDGIDTPELQRGVRKLIKQLARP